MLLEEHIALHLIDGGGHVLEGDEVGQPVRVEAAHPDGPDLSLPAQLGHGPPGPVVVAQGLVDQVQIQVVQAQPVHGGLEPPLGPLTACIGDPQLGGDEQLLPGEAALPHRLAHRLLVAVGGRRVDEAVAHVDGVPHRPLTLGRVLDLIGAEAQLGHFHAVI